MRDRRGRSPSPKRLGEVLGDFRDDVSPETALAAIQGVWEEVVGERIAAVTEPIDEREGVLTVECSSAVWAQELDLMGPRIASRLRAALDGPVPAQIRFRTSA